MQLKIEDNNSIKSGSLHAISLDGALLQFHPFHVMSKALYMSTQSIKFSIISIYDSFILKMTNKARFSQQSAGWLTILLFYPIWLTVVSNNILFFKKNFSIFLWYCWLSYYDVWQKVKSFDRIFLIKIYFCVNENVKFIE